MRNKAANAVRDAKKQATKAVLGDNSISQWQKIKIFQGSINQGNNTIKEMDYNGSKATYNSAKATGLNNKSDIVCEFCQSKTV